MFLDEVYILCINQSSEILLTLFDYSNKPYFSGKISLIHKFREL